MAVGLLSAPTDTADAAAAGPSSSAPPPPLPPPLAAAECKPEGEGDMLSQDDTNLLFLLANIANGDDNAEQGGARARCVPATSAILARLLGSLLPFLVPLHSSSHRFQAQSCAFLSLCAWLRAGVEHLPAAAAAAPTHRAK